MVRVTTKTAAAQTMYLTFMVSSCSELRVVKEPASPNLPCRQDKASQGKLHEAALTKHSFCVAG